jgi:uncharacterized membrane protein
MRWLIVPLFALCLPACTIAVPDISSASVPDNPTYAHDVRPYLADHCLLCHSSPPDYGAPSTFRLDVLDYTGSIPGAQSMAKPMIDDVVSANPHQMPPGNGLGPNGKRLLVNWFANSAP